MKIENGEIITLEDNKEYICVSTLEHDNATYLYLMSNFKPLEIIFAKQLLENNETVIEIVNNKDKKIELLSLFQNQINN